MKTVVVTGANGQIGSYFTDFLLEEGFFVIAVSRYRHSGFLDPNKKGLQLFTLELDGQAIEDLIVFFKPDYFINCAAKSSVSGSWGAPEEYFATNATAVLKQLEAIRKFSPLTRYLNFGSYEEFSADNPYAFSKAAARQIVDAYKEKGIFAVQPWCANCESPRRGESFVTKKIAMGVAAILVAIEKGQPFKPIKLGNLDSPRDWSHATDFVDGAWKMLNQSSPRNYNLCSGDRHTVREFANLILKEAQIDGEWVGAGMEEKFVVANYLFDISKVLSAVIFEVDPLLYRPTPVTNVLTQSTNTKRDLGWAPKISFDTLAKSMLEAEVSNGQTRPKAEQPPRDRQPIRYCRRGLKGQVFLGTGNEACGAIDAKIRLRLPHSNEPAAGIQGQQPPLVFWRRRSWIRRRPIV